MEDEHTRDEVRDMATDIRATSTTKLTHPIQDEAAEERYTVYNTKKRIIHSKKAIYIFAFFSILILLLYFISDNRMALESVLPDIQVSFVWIFPVNVGLVCLVKFAEGNPFHEIRLVYFTLFLACLFVGMIIYLMYGSTKPLGYDFLVWFEGWNFENNTIQTFLDENAGSMTADEMVQRYIAADDAESFEDMKDIGERVVSERPFAIHGRHYRTRLTHSLAQLESAFSGS